MSASVDFTNAAALQDYIRKFMPELIGKLYHGFPSAQIFTPHEGVKGQLVLTEMILGTLAKFWTKTFNPSADKISFKPRTLTTVPVKVDLQIYPQEFESTYLGMARRPGFQPDDLPFQGFIMDKVMQQIQSELEIAAYQAVTNSPAAESPLVDLFDGLLKIVADEITANNLTATTTAAHTTSNAVANAEAVHGALAPVYQRAETVMLCSVAFAKLYLSNYREDYGKYIGTDKTDPLKQIRLDFGNCFLVPSIGMGTSSRLICTPRENIHYGYDLEGDAANIRIQQIHRSTDIMVDFKFGVQFGIVHPSILAVNNLT